jgi:hypothetical protein
MDERTCYYDEEKYRKLKIDVACSEKHKNHAIQVNLDAANRLKHFESIYQIKSRETERPVQSVTQIY